MSYPLFYNEPLGAYKQLKKYACISLLLFMCETSKVTSGKIENPVFFYLRDYYKALSNKATSEVA